MPLTHLVARSSAKAPKDLKQLTRGSPWRTFCCGRPPLSLPRPGADPMLPGAHELRTCPVAMRMTMEKWQRHEWKFMRGGRTRRKEIAPQTVSAFRWPSLAGRLDFCHTGFATSPPKDCQGATHHNSGAAGWREQGRAEAPTGAKAGFGALFY